MTKKQKRLNKIWTDPVWSKIIAAVIIGLGTIIWTLVSAQINNIDFQTAWTNFWNLKISLWLLTIIVLLGLLSYWLIKYLKKESFEYDDETLTLDKQIFEKIRTDLLPQTGAIYFLRHNNFAGFSFKIENVEDLDKFEYECKNPDFEFLHPNLEKLRIELLEYVAHFTTLVGLETFPTNNGRQTVPPEWETDQPERFWKVVNDFHETKHKICQTYDDLIKSGRRLLKI